MILGTQGYEQEAPELLKRYESMSFEDAHSGLLDLVPPSRISVLDIGAGTGRDAAWFAARGDNVTAIEPTRAMREGSMALHAEPITWIDDSLPDLVRVRGRAFDLVWMSAVWMHFDESERAAMMPTVAALVATRGALMISLRQAEPYPSRRMFRVSAEETKKLAQKSGLACVRHITIESAFAPGVDWDRLWFTQR